MNIGAPHSPRFSLCWRALSVVWACCLAGAFPGRVPAAEPVTPLNPRLSGSPFIQVWRAGDYHASPVNWRVLQHPQTGLVYVSNNFGVLEFDGTTTRLIPLPRGGAARALVLDPAGQIWVSGLGEVARLTPDASGLLVAVDLTERVAAGATERVSTAVADDDEPAGGANSGPAPLRALGNLNRATAGTDGVYFRLPDTIAHFTPQGVARLLPAAGRIGQLWWMDGALHVADLDRGILRLRDGQFAPASGGGKIDVFAAQPDPRGGWRLLTTRGPQHWPGPDAPDPGTRKQFEGEEPTCAIFLRDGRSAYGTPRSGVLIFDAAGRLERQIDRSHGLPANRVNGLATDREGGLWLALHTGVARVQLDSPFALHGPAQGLAGSPRFLLRAHERLYVSHGEGLAWRSDSDGEFHAIAGFRTGSHRLAPWQDRVVVTAQGLHELGRADDATLHLAGPYLYAATPLQRAPNWLVASSALAVRLFRKDPGAPWRQDGALQTLPAGADDLLETSDGFLWVVTRNAELWRVDLRQGLRPDAPARRYGPEQGVAPAARRDGPRLLRLGDDLLVSSARWLLRYDPAADRFVPETRFPELIDPSTQRRAAMAVPAADGGAWFYFEGAAPWIGRVRPAPDRTWRVEQIPASSLADLITNHLYDDPALHTLWVATQGFLVSIDLEWQPAHARPELQAMIRSLQVPDGKGQWIARSLTTDASGATPHAPAVLRLPPNQSTLRFTYAAPTFETNYAGKSDIRFRTQIAGFEPGWSAWTSEPYRDFTNLPAGQFTFSVQARDYAGRMSTTSTLAFSLAPSWWQTPWAWSGGAVLAASGVLGLVRLRTHTLQRRAEQLEGVVAERTRELAARNAELARLHRLELDENATLRLAEEKARLEVLRYQLNPHFLYNTLNSIYGLVFPHSRPASDVVRRFADFCRMTLTRDDTGLQRTVAEELNMLRAYLDLEQARWGKRLDFTVACDAAVAEVPLPPFLLLPLVENAVKYGAASSPELLYIRVHARPHTPSGVEIEIANTGTWFEPGAAASVPSTGIGVENLRQRLARYYPGRHELQLGPEGAWVLARLRLIRVTGEDGQASPPPVT